MEEDVSDFWLKLPEFKPRIVINRSEGYIEAFYRDCSYVARPNDVAEGYYSIDTNELIGWRIPLHMNEDFDILFR